MAVPHAESGAIIDVRPWGEALAQAVTTTLVATDRLKILRLALRAGKTIPEHQAPGEITVQCLEGSVEFQAHGRTRTLPAGRMLYLAAAEPHALTATEDSSLLVTLLLNRD